MPQFIQAQGVDPILLQMQQQAVSGRQAGLEQARLNAGQYMKDFRQDAQNAGYSLGEWAKRNESNVKNALFALSGNNQNVTNQRFEELANAPESFGQKQQRLEDKFVATTSDELMGKAATFITTTEDIPGTPGTKNIGMGIEDFRTKAKEKGYTDILSAGKLLFGEDADLNYKGGKGSPEALKFWDWRINTAKAYGLADFEGSPEQNKWLYDKIINETPSGSVEIPDTYYTSIKPEFEETYQAVLQELKDRPAEAFAGSSGIEEMLANPAARAGAQRRMLDMIEGGAPAHIIAGQLGGYTIAQAKELFEEGSKGGTWTFEGQLPPLSFKGEAPTEARTVTTRTEVDPGEPGFLDQKQEYYDNLVGRGVSQSDIVAKAQQLRAADTKDEKDKASTALYDAQAALVWEQVAAAKIPPGPTTTQYFKQFQAQQEDMFKLYTPDEMLKIKFQSKEYYIYLSKLTALVNTARSAGMFVDTRPITGEEIELKADGWFKDTGTLPVISNVAPQFTTGRADLSTVTTNVQNIMQGTK